MGNDIESEARGAKQFLISLLALVRRSRALSESDVPSRGYLIGLLYFRSMRTRITSSTRMAADTPGSPPRIVREPEASRQNCSCSDAFSSRAAVGGS